MLIDLIVCISIIFGLRISAQKIKMIQSKHLSSVSVIIYRSIVYLL